MADYLNQNYGSHCKKSSWFKDKSIVFWISTISHSKLLLKNKKIKPESVLNLIKNKTRNID